MSSAPLPRGWGKSHLVDSIRLAEAAKPEAAKPEPQVWVDSRGRIVLDVYLEWNAAGAWVRVDVKTKREGENGFLFRRVISHPMPEKLHTRDRATALRAYGDMEAIKLGMPWRPRGRL